MTTPPPLASLLLEHRDDAENKRRSGKRRSEKRRSRKRRSGKIGVGK